MEVWDILDENGNITGETMCKGDKKVCFSLTNSHLSFINMPFLNISSISSKVANFTSDTSSSCIIILFKSTSDENGNITGETMCKGDKKVWEEGIYHQGVDAWITIHLALASF